MQEGVVNVPLSGPRLLVLTDVGEDAAAEGRATGGYDLRWNLGLGCCFNSLQFAIENGHRNSRFSH